MQPQTSKIVHYWYFTNHTETRPLPISTARTCLRQPVEFCKKGAHHTVWSEHCVLHMVIAVGRNIAMVHPKCFWRQMDENEYQIGKRSPQF